MNRSETPDTSELPWKSLDVASRIWLEHDGVPLIETERCALLMAIDRTKNLTVAAKERGISYRKAWQIIQDVNSTSIGTLVSATAGGTQGGVSDLTELGRSLVQLSSDLTTDVEKMASARLQALIQNARRDSHKLRIVAAISLQEFVERCIASYIETRMASDHAAKRETEAVDFHTFFAASNDLSSLIAAGMEFDFFLSAGKDSITKLVREDWIEKESLARFASNSLSILGHLPRNDRTSVKQLLTKTRGRIAVARSNVPLGKLTKQYLKSIGVWEQLSDRLMMLNDSASVVTAAKTSACELAIVFTSHTIRNRDVDVIREISPSEAKLDYWLGLRNVRRREDQITEFADWFVDERTLKLKRQCGLAE